MLRNVSKTFDTPGGGAPVVAVQHVNCRVAPGEFLCIIGPSGCGKTTLLQMLAGFTRPSGGEALHDGVPIAGPGPDRTVMFQEYGLFPWLTVAENIAFGLRAKRLPRAERDRIVARHIELVRLGGFASSYPDQLSGGMKQRVSIARALAPDPGVILMDEPFAALDSLTRDLLQEEIMTVWEQTRKTVVLITHNIEEAIFMGDRVLVMTARPGRVKAVVDIPLARPRAPEIRSHDKLFLQLKDQLTQLLRSEYAGAGAAH
jgi:ABC-type nitrate/sulfonate/bicarbonate transport system ATPase subunit